jgi:hypothetical protein
VDYKLLKEEVSIHSNYATKLPSQAALFYGCVKVQCMWFSWKTDCNLVLLQRKINTMKFTALKFEFYMLLNNLASC